VARAKTSPFLYTLSTWIAEGSMYIFLGIGLYVFTQSFVGPRIIALTIAAVVLGRGIIKPVLKILFPRPRPHQVEGHVLRHNFGWHGVFGSRQGGSFPSGHTVGLVAMSGVWIYFLPLLGLPCFMLAILTGFARALVGHHYISDALGGILFGILSAAVVLALGVPFLFA
jgi:membrane-associated phospholipid phosphatase